MKFGQRLLPKFHDFKKPIGVSGYQVSILDSLTKELKKNLPTVEEIEAEFSV